MSSVLIGLMCWSTVGNIAPVETRKPCAVFFYGRYAPFERVFQREVVKELGVEPDRVLQTRLNQKSEFYDYDVPEGMLRREGIAHYFKPGSAETDVLRFVTMPDVDSFEQFVSKRAAGESEVVVEGTGSRRSLHSPGNSIYFRFEQQAQIAVYGWAESLVYDSDITPFTKALKTVGRGHSYFSIRPEAVEGNAKMALFRSLQAHTYVRLQSTDDESDTDSELRWRFGEAWLQIIGLLVTELEEVSWWYSYPSGSEPAEYGFKARFVPKGKVSRYLARTSGRQRFKLAQSIDGAVVRASLNMHLGEVGATMLKDLLAKQLPNQWAALVASLISEDVELHAVLLSRPDEQTLRIASGQEPKWPDQILARTSTRESTIGTFSTVRLRPNMKRQANVDEVDIVERASTRDRAWLRASLDLKALGDSQSMAGAIKPIEQIVDGWKYDRTMSRMAPLFLHKRFKNATELPDGSFRSLSSRLTPEGDWTASVTVAPRGNVVIGNSSIGPELFKWLFARNLMADIRIRKQLTEDRNRQSR